MLFGHVKNAVILVVLYIVTYFVREIMESKCMGDRMGIAPFTMLAVIYIGILVYGVVGFILGPISYCIIKALVLYLKSILEHVRKAGFPQPTVSVPFPYQISEVRQ